MLGFAKQLLDELAAEIPDETLINDFMTEYAEWAALDDPAEASQVFFTLYNKLVEAKPAQAYVFLQKATSLAAQGASGSGSTDW